MSTNINTIPIINDRFAGFVTKTKKKERRKKLIYLWMKNGLPLVVVNKEEDYKKIEMMKKEEEIKSYKNLQVLIYSWCCQCCLISPTMQDCQILFVTFDSNHLRPWYNHDKISTNLQLSIINSID